MRPTLIAIAALGEIVSWRFVARSGRASEWDLMIVVFIVQGAIGLIGWHIDWYTGRAAATVVAAGLAAGAVLYGATRAFVGVADRSPLFRSHVAHRYEHARLVSLPVGLVLALLIAVPGEELFWRGFVQGIAGDHRSELVAMSVALAGYICVKAASGSLPLIAAAVVGGAVWGGLAVFAGGILAAVLCHGLWTGLMLAFPPTAGRDDPPPGERMAA
ncbi:MAG: CPBP family intramembrane glutamic endopeptidase [Vicinamibacteria bacterium]